jgi:Ca2+-binding EF-hand superfamily protein
MKRLLLAAAFLALGSAGLAQNAPKPVSRADFVKNLDARFAAMDTNHDGKVDHNEMVAQQQRDLQLARTRIAQQLEGKFRQLDTNKDGQLSLPEFMAAAPTIKTSETPDELIQKYDTNHDGKVSADEFRAPEMAKFNRADTNHDGIVSPAELQAPAARK